MARVEMIAPTWDVQPFFSAPSVSLDPIVALARRVGRHTFVAALAMLSGLLLWLPPGFGLGAATRVVLGIGTGVGVAVIATVISMAISPARPE